MHLKSGVVGWGGGKDTFFILMVSAPFIKQFNLSVTGPQWHGYVVTLFLYIDMGRSPSFPLHLSSRKNQQEFNLDDFKFHIFNTSLRNKLKHCCSSLCCNSSRFKIHVWLSFTFHIYLSLLPKQFHQKGVYRFQQMVAIMKTLTPFIDVSLPTVSSLTPSSCLCVPHRGKVIGKPGRSLLWCQLEIQPHTFLSSQWSPLLDFSSKPQ